MRKWLSINAQMIIWLREVNLRGVDLAGHELGEESVSKMA